MSDATTFKHHLTDLIWRIEVRTKTKNIESDIIVLAQQHTKSGIIYC
jgi:ATP-dependent DNA helicase RecQ